MIAAALAAVAAALPPQPLLLYARSGRIHLVRADGTGDRVVASGTTPAWSPDGRRIAFVRELRRPRRGAVYVVAADGTGLQRATRVFRSAASHEPPVERPLWSPDGRRLAFVAGGDLRLADVASGRTTTLPTPSTFFESIRWTRRGALAVCVDGTRTTLYVYAPGRPRRANTLRRRCLDAPVPSPDGTRSLSVRGDRRSNGQLWVEDGRGRRAKLTNDVPRDPLTHFDHCCAVWSPDGSRIAFLRSSPGAYAGDLFTVRADGTGERRLTWGGAAWPDFSSDTSLLAVMVGRNLAVAPVGGGPLRVVARRVEYARSWWQPRRVHPIRQPDLRQIHVPPHPIVVRRTMLPPARAHLSHVRRFGLQHGLLLDMAPSGRLLSIVAWERHAFSLGVVDLAAGRVTTLLRRRANWLWAAGNGTFSRDGRRIAFWDGRSLETVDVHTGHVALVRAARPGPVWWLREGRLAYVDRRGRILGVRVPLPAYAALSPNGSSLLYASRCAVRMRDLASGASRVLARGFYAPASWAPDGRHFVLQAGQWYRNCRAFSSYPSGGFTLYGARGRRLGDVGGGGASWSTDGSLLFLYDGVTGTAVAYLQPLSVVSMRTLRVASLFHDRACDNAFAGPGGWILYCRYGHIPPGVSFEDAQLPARLYVARLRLPTR